MNVLEGFAFTLICAGIIFPIIMQFITTDREITKEEAENKARIKYRKEIEYWKDKAQETTIIVEELNNGKCVLTKCDR